MRSKRRTTRFLTIAAVALILTGPAMAATWYASPSGTGDGTTEAAPMAWAVWKGSDRSADTCYIVGMDSTISEDFYWVPCQGYYAEYVQFYSSHSIGYTFADYERIFQFANGDIGVVGPVSIIALTPSPSTFVSGETTYKYHGTMVDPVVDWNQSWHEKANNYSDGANVGPAIAAGTPYALTAGHTMVHSYGHTEYVNGFSYIYEYAALHCVSEVPAVLSFRPTYAGGTATKTIHAASEVNLSLLADLAPVATGCPTKSECEAFCRPLFVEKMPSYTNVYIRSTGSRNSSYGSYLTAKWSNYAIWTNTSQTEADKLFTVRCLVQSGIDLWGMMHSSTLGRRLLTHDNGGHGGTKMRWAYAAWLLEDETMLATLAKTGDYLASTRTSKNWPNDIFVSSDEQARTIEASDVLSTPWPVGGATWGNNAGTVNVTHNSTTVTGNGTAWAGIAAANRKRIALVDTGLASDNLGTDVNARAYNIASVVSNTELTLSTPYTGETANEKAYWIAGSLVYGHGTVAGMADDNYGNAEDTREPTAEDVGLPIWSIAWGYHDYEAPAVSPAGNGWYTGSVGDFVRKYQPTFLQASVGGTFLALVMGMRDEWNHESSFNYADRAATVNNRDADWWESWQRLMWEQYRSDYSPIWTPKCHTPVPTHSAIAIATSQVLSWYDGNGRATGTSCNVYFGTDSTPDETELVETESTDYAYAPTLAAGTTYYWRVDEVCPGGTYTGDVWSFTTDGGEDPPAQQQFIMIYQP